MYANGSGAPAVGGTGAGGEYLGDWYNDWGDFVGDVQNIAGWVRNLGGRVAQTGQAGSNAAANISNPFAFRVNLTTAVAAAVGVGGAVYLLTRRRRR